MADAKQEWEECYKCGGWGGEPGANFGDYGWHPCFKCGASGRLPKGTLDREIAESEAMAWAEAQARADAMAETLQQGGPPCHET